MSFPSKQGDKHGFCRAVRPLFYIQKNVIPLLLYIGAWKRCVKVLLVSEPLRSAEGVEKNVHFEKHLIEQGR